MTFVAIFIPGREDLFPFIIPFSGKDTSLRLGTGPKEGSAKGTRTLGHTLHNQKILFIKSYRNRKRRP